MALRGVLEHPKFASLQTRLGLRKYETLGLLEGLWQFCGRYTPAGNIGKYPIGEIASWLQWQHDPDALIDALVDSRWLDRSEDFGLLVHHWDEWAEDSVHAQLARRRELFATGTIPRMKRLNTDERSAFKLALENGELSIRADKSGSTPSSTASTTASSPASSTSGKSAVPLPLPLPIPIPIPIPKTLAQSDKKHRSMPEEDSVFDLPLVGDKNYGVPQHLFNEYVAAYPGVSVMAELGKLRAWLLSNPKKMNVNPTGIKRRMNHWLSGAQNNQPHGGRNGNVPTGKSDRNLAVLAQSLAEDERQDRARTHGLLSAGGDGRDDS